MATETKPYPSIAEQQEAELRRLNALVDDLLFENSALRRNVNDLFATATAQILRIEDLLDQRVKLWIGLIGIPLFALFCSKWGVE